MIDHWKRTSLVSLIALLLLGAAIFIAACGSGHPTQTTPVPNPSPTVQSISPTFVVAGTSSQSVTITGSGFLSSSTVTFNGASHAAAFNNSGQLTLTLSGTDLATAGNFPIVVTNPSPGGGASLATTFSVWGTFADINSGISFGVPLFGTSTPTVTSLTPSGGVFSFDIDGWNTAQGKAVPVIEVSEYPNTSGATLQQWFETNVDINGLLEAAGTYSSKQLPNGAFIMTLAAPVPDQYLTVGAPTEEAYAMSPDGKYLITMTEAYNAQVSDYGYNSIPVLEEILGTMNSK